MSEMVVCFQLQAFLYSLRKTIGRRYVRKTRRQSWNKEDRKSAMRSVRINNKSVNSAAKENGILEPTLQRYLRKYEDEIFPSYAGWFKTTFSEEQLNNLFQYILNIDKRAFGLTEDQFGRVIYNNAENKKIPHRFNTDKERASRDFVEWFMRKYKSSLRCPEATSVARLMAFNRENVNKFYEALRESKEKYSFKPHQIYNSD
ncbi:hypothetical protein JTB14_025251 [Gonioctena quinquepunctata]|nr:hypothetical protein JTB14_025251 [Gonioctena quinquepunctata]